MDHIVRRRMNSIERFVLGQDELKIIIKWIRRVGTLFCSRGKNRRKTPQRRHIVLAADTAYKIF